MRAPVAGGAAAALRRPRGRARRCSTRRWRPRAPAQGRLVEISGEAGIGKTRLVEELHGRAPGLRAGPRRLRRLRELGALRDLARAAAPARRRRPAGLRRRSWSSACACGSPGASPSSWPGCRCWRCRSASTCGRRPRSRAWRRSSPPPSCTASTADLLRVLLPDAFLLEVEDVHLMDAASADLLAAVTAELGAAPGSPLATRRDADGRLQRARRAARPPSRARRAARRRRHCTSPRPPRSTTRRRRTSWRSPPSAPAATRSSCAICCRPWPPAARATCRTPSRPPPWRASTGWRRPTATSCGGPPCSACASRSATCPARARRRHAGARRRHLAPAAPR